MLNVLDLVDGYQGTCVLMAAADLGVFDVLATRPKGIGDLARDICANESALRRLLRALAAHDLVAADGDEVTLTETGRRFVSGSAEAAHLMLLREEYLSAWAALGYSVRSGQPAFESGFQMSVWEHRRRNPRINAAFNSMVARAQAIAVVAIADAYDFSAFHTIADIGGGNGYLLAGILRRHRALTGVLFDLPHVVESARRELCLAGVQDRCRTVPGSFFDGIPLDCDVYVLQYVLHDWSDERCIEILQRCRDAIQPAGRLLILEKIFPERDSMAPPALVMRDLHMMAVLGGRERKLGEYDELLHAAGLRRTAYVPLAPYCPDIIEVTAAP
jgi:hypothetical protein